jgi:hypothetical protein
MRRSPSPSRARCAATSCRAGRAWRRTARRPHGPAGSRPQVRPRRSAPGADETRFAARWRLGPALIARPASDTSNSSSTALDDQPCELRSGCRGFSPTPRPAAHRSAPRSPPTAVPCVARRRSSFIVFTGREGTYAVSLTGPAAESAGFAFQQPPPEPHGLRCHWGRLRGPITVRVLVGRAIDTTNIAALRRSLAYSMIGRQSLPDQAQRRLLAARSGLPP